jgi:O-antigen/teichoic acid export membrane protein
MLKSSLFKNILSVISTRLLLKGINFLSLYMLLRYLSPEQLGEYGLFISTLVLATTIGNLGLRNSVARDIGNKGSLELNTKALAVAYPLLMFASTFVMLLTLYSSGFVLEFTLKFFAIIIAVVCHLIIILRQGICLGTGEIKLFNLLEVIPRLVLLIIIFIVVKGLDDIYQEVAIYGLTLGYIVSAAYALMKTKLTLSIVANDQARYLFKTGFAFCLALSLILLNTRVPLYVTNLLQDTAEAGQVFAALRINDIFLELATAAGLVLFSHAARSNSDIDLAKMLKAIAGVFIATVFISIGTSFFATDIIMLVSGDKYKTAAVYLSIATLGLPFAAFNKMAYGVISGKGKPMLGVYVYSLVVPINLLISFVLYKQNIESFVLYALVISQLIASLAFLSIILNLNKKQVLDH